MKHVLTILAVRDLALSAGFYQRAFGWQREVSVPSYVEFHLPDGMRIGIYQQEGFALNTGAAPHLAPQGSITATELYFHVDDVGAAAQRLEKAGARVLSAALARPWGDLAAYFADPDGNVLVVARALAAS